ncbi:hypothetical protein D9981_18895 [Pseudoalteromonas phenolica O-BC30]|nr:hypothetical protein D9981_18895 [Pseudoalteromonas phenolica O-BC30]
MGEQASQTDIGKALGADVLLESVFNCRNSLCEVTLNAIDAHTATLLDTTRYSVDTESFSEAYHNSLVNIEALFDKRFTSQTYSDAFYDKYVAQVEAFQSGSQDIAVTLAEVKSLIRQEPNFVPLYRFYRKVVVEEHRIQQNNNVIWDFLDALEQAPETYKNSHNYIIDRIQAYQTIKDWQKAEMLISELSILDIEKFELYSVKANFYREKFDYPKALKSITLAYKLKPTVQVVRNTAIIYLLNGNYEKANEHLKKLIDTAQFDFWALRTYADISLLNGNSQSAIDAYLKLLINNPRNANALSNIAIAYSLIGNFKNSHEYARKAYNINPSNLSIVLNFADSYSYLKHSSEAYKLYTQIIDLTAETNDIDELIIRAQALLHTGNKVEALQLITKIENETSNIHDLMFSKAMILTKLGEHQSALLLIESSIKDGWNKSFYGLPWFKDLCQYRLKFMQTIGANDFNSLCSNSIE